MEHWMHSRKAKALVISFTLGAIAVTGGFAVKGYARAAAYEQYLANGYLHAFSELTTAMGEINTALQKSSYATSPSLLSSLCTEMFGRAMSAQMAIGELPYGNMELEKTAAFVAKVGDYAVALSRSAAASGACSDEDRKTLRALAASSSTLSQMLNDLQADIYAGTASLEDLEMAEARLSAATEDGSQVLGGGSFQSVESEFPEIPTLIYDGPFSEHLSRRNPKMLEDQAQVTQEQAKESAARFLDLKPEIFTLVSDCQGDIPTWCLTAMVDGGELYVEVTQKGGLVIEVTNSRSLGETTLSPDEAVRVAADFIKARGYPDMAYTYFINQSGILTVNFAATSGDVICYSDLVEVSVALDNGRVVGFRSVGYLTNHVSRTLPAPTLPLAEAQLKLDPGLKLLSQQLALIPTPGGNEILCYEFKCQIENGQNYIVYLNADTGVEEKILLLLEDESGTLVL